MPVVLHICKTCSLVLREEYSLGEFGTRMIRKIFGPRRGEATGN
jgi:hypothetical protein